MRTRMFNYLCRVVFIMSIVLIRFADPADAATVNFSSLFTSGNSITSLDGSLRFDQFTGDSTFSDTITQIPGGLLFQQSTPKIDQTDIGSFQDGFVYRVTVLTPPQTLQGFQQSVTAPLSFGSQSFSLQSSFLSPPSTAIGTSTVSATLPGQVFPVTHFTFLSGSHDQAFQTLLLSLTTDQNALGASQNSSIAHIYALTPLTPVPLPPAVILFGAGLVALVGLGAGRWRRQKSTLA